MSEVKDNKALVEKWTPLLFEAKNTEPVPQYLSEKTALILENEEEYIKEAADLNTSSDIGQFTPILIPAVRRIFPQLLAHQLVGVQPMSGPTGYAYALRYVYGNNSDHPVNGISNVDRGSGDPKWSSQVVIFDKTGINVGDSVKAAGGTTVLATVRYVEDGNRALVELADPNAPLSTGTAYDVGSVTGTTATFVIQNEAGYNVILKNYSGPYTTAEGETKTDANTLKASLERVSIEAMTRFLKTEYSIEFAQDLKAMHGLNAEQELINILEYEITAEIDRELVGRINSKATQVTPWSYTAVAGNQGRWELEKFRTLYTKITSEANKIAVTSRRGAGNFIIGSINAITALQNLKGFLYASVPGEVSVGTGIMKVGTIDGRFNVYVDTFAFDDYVTVGYKGASSFDTGIIYSPYVPLMMQKVTDPETFQPKIGFKTRYAIVDNLFGTQNYYRTFAADFTGSSLK